MSIGSSHAAPTVVGTTDWGTLTTMGASSPFHAAAHTSYDHYFSFVLDDSYMLSLTAVVNNNARSIFTNNFADLEKLNGDQWTYLEEFEFFNTSTTHEFGLQGPGHYRSEVTADSTGSTTAYGSIQALIDPVEVMPVPEPETYALLLAGLSAMGFVARRRKSV